jgi:signal transduction histidine kinase
VAVGLLSLPGATLVAALLPAPLRAAGWVTTIAALVAVAGLPRVVRHACVWLANRLLGTRLPAPTTTARAGWPNRCRTGAWLLLNSIVGTALLTTTGLLVLGAVSLPVVWLGGGGPIDAFGFSPRIARGWPGAWTVPAAAGCLVLIAYASAGATALMRTSAPSLLGHRTSERLADLERREDLLARRNRLARELHDSIGHTLTASTIQAAAAARMLDTDPDMARRALGSIEEASRTALEDLDHVLGVLREGPPPRAPEHTLASIHALVDGVRNAGADVRLDITGDVTRVPATVSREAYRIVQEGLTNALRHAGPVPVTMRLTVRAERLEVELTNPLSSDPEPARLDRQGHGLAGIAERVRLLRGEVSAGPVAGEPGAARAVASRWVLVAWMPLPPAQ